MRRGKGRRVAGVVIVEMTVDYAVYFFWVDAAFSKDFGDAFLDAEITTIVGEALSDGARKVLPVFADAVESENRLVPFRVQGRERGVQDCLGANERENRESKAYSKSNRYLHPVGRCVTRNERAAQFRYIS